MSSDKTTGSESPLIFMYTCSDTMLTSPSSTIGCPPHSLFTVFCSASAHLHTNENLHKTAEETGEEEGKSRQQQRSRYSNAYGKTRDKVYVPLFGRCLQIYQQHGKKDGGKYLPHHNKSPPPWCRLAAGALLIVPVLLLLVCALLLALSPIGTLLGSFRSNEEEDALARASGSEDSLVSILGLSPAIALSSSSSSSSSLLEPTASLKNGVEVPPYSPLAVMDVVLSDLYEKNGMVPSALVHELREQRGEMIRAAHSPLSQRVVGEENKGSQPTRKRSRITLRRYLRPQQQQLTVNGGGKGGEDDSRQIHLLDGPPYHKSQSGSNRVGGDAHFSSLKEEDLAEVRGGGRGKRLFSDSSIQHSNNFKDRTTGQIFGNSLASFIHFFPKVVKSGEDSAHSSTPLQSLDLPFIIPRQSLVYPSYKGSFNRNYKIVANFSDKICRKVTTRFAGNAPLNMNNGLSRTILPKCPRILSSDPRRDDAPEKSFRLHSPVTFTKQQRRQMPSACSSLHVENGEPTSMFNSSNWTNLRDDHLEAILLKILRLLLKNTGCDDLINGKSDVTMEEFFGPIRDEFLHEYTVLTVGSMSTTCGRADSFLASFFAGAGRVNILSLDYLPSGNDWSLPSTEERTPRVFLSSAFQPSSLHSCYVPPPSSTEYSVRSPTTNTLTALDSLSFIASDTFCSVIAFDSFLASVPNDLLCETVQALLRVIKIGGAVWVGHEADGERVRILSGCRVEQCEGYTIEMSEIKESIFLSKMIEFPDHLLSEGSLRSFVWRKETSTFFEDVSEFELGTRRKADRQRIDGSGGQRAPLASKAIDAEALAMLFKGGRQ